MLDKAVAGHGKDDDNEIVDGVDVVDGEDGVEGGKRHGGQQ